MMKRFGSFGSFVATLLLFSCICDAFVPSSRQFALPRSCSSLRMSLDLVTYLRTEWISAALCTNQIPRAADICLQLGCEDGRAVNFIPRTIRVLITSSLEQDGRLKVGVKRQLKQQQERRKAATISYVDQRVDDLKETEDESVDVVISLQAAARMIENGLDWKKSVREAARVLKPGGRLLFVEQTDLSGESYLDYVDNLYTLNGEGEMPEDKNELYPVFEEVGYDDVDLVLVPHVAGVAIKSVDAGLTAQERAQKEANLEKERMADLSLEAYERGIKKKKKRKKKKGMTEESASA
jgi:ubiquinone/menaquinone biosynthesis C-methylase UbiE